MRVKNKRTGRPKKYTQEFIDNVADELIQWLTDPAHRFLGDFCLEKGLHKDSLNTWARQNKKFKEVYEKAKDKKQINSVIINLGRNFNKLKNLKEIKETCRMILHGT